MLTRFLAVALVAAFAPFASASPKDSCFYVQVDRGGGVTAGGSATIIATENGRSLALTAGHVVEGAQSVQLIQLDSNGKPWSYRAKLLDASGSGGIYPDLALLETPYELPAVEIAEEEPAGRGYIMTTFGFGGATSWEPIERTGYSESRGNFSDPWFVSTVPIVAGDSGCATFNSKGEVVAVNSLRVIESGRALGANVASITHFTVTTIKSKRLLFPRLHDRLAARKIMKAVKPYLPAPYPAPAATPKPPAAAPAPAQSSCPGGVCPAPTTRRFFFRRW